MYQNRGAPWHIVHLKHIRMTLTVERNKVVFTSGNSKTGTFCRRRRSWRLQCVPGNVFAIDRKLPGGRLLTLTKPTNTNRADTLLVIFLGIIGIFVIGLAARVKQLVESVHERSTQCTVLKLPTADDRKRTAHSGCNHGPSNWTRSPECRAEQRA